MKYNEKTKKHKTKNKKTKNKKLFITGDMTIEQIKEELWKLKTHDLKEPELYCLKYKGQNDETIELFDEQQLLQNVSIIPHWRTNGISPSFIVDFKKRPISKKVFSSFFSFLFDFEVFLTIFENRHSYLT